MRSQGRKWAAVRRRPATSAAGARAAFSLIEVMIALTVLGLGLLGLAGAQLQALKGGASGRHLSKAAIIGQTEIERLQRERWTNIPPIGWNQIGVVAEVVQGVPNQNEMTYSLFHRVTDVVPGQTRAIDVRVIWSEPSRPNRSATFSSIRYNREAL